MRASLVFLMVKNLPARQETQVQSLGWEYPLEKGMVTHSSILVPFHGQRSLVDYNSQGHTELDTNKCLRKKSIGTMGFIGEEREKGQQNYFKKLWLKLSKLRKGNRYPDSKGPENFK